MHAHNIQTNPEFSSDDDFEYYRREVGVEPSNELLLSKPKRVKYDESDTHSNRGNLNETSVNARKEIFDKKDGKFNPQRGFKSRQENGFQTRKRSGFKHSQEDSGKFKRRGFQRENFGNKFGSRDKPKRGGKAPGGRVYRVRKKF